MSDSEEEVPQEEGEEIEQTKFETADAGASHTYPQTASAVRKGGFMVIKGRPCKVIDVSTSKTGKHGHAKCHFVATDIFTSKKMEELVPSSHNLEVPHVSRQDYSLLDISDDGFVSLMDDAGNTKDDLKLPNEDELAKEIKTGFDDGKELVVTVLKSMGEEMINAVKEAATK
jgi:translation initiation factor 5A